MKWRLVLVLTLFAIYMEASYAWEAYFVDDGVIMAHYKWLSDDGSRMAYIKDMDENPITGWDREVFYADFNSMQVSRITRDVEEDAFAAISPDGSKVAYASGDNVFADDWETTKNLYLYDVSSGRITRIDTYTSEDSSTLDYVGFVTDGRVILCIKWWIPNPSCGDNCYDIPQYCYVYDTNTRAVDMAIGNRYEYHWWESISETKIVYRKGDYYYHTLPLYEWYIPADRNYRLFQPEENEYVSVRASNTGKIALYYSGTGEGKKGLFIYEGGRLMPAVYNPCDHPDRFSDFAISKDGSRLIYTCAAPENNPTRFSVRVVDTGSFENIKIFEASIGDSVDGHPIPEFSDIHILGVDEDGSSIVIGLSDRGGRFWSDQVWLLTEGGIVAEEGSTEEGETTEDSEIPIEQTTVIFMSGSGSYGDEIQIPVEIRNARNIGSMNIDVSEDTDVLKPIGVLPGSLTQNALFEYNIVNEKVKVAIVSSDGISGDGSLFYVKFEVNRPEEQKKQPLKGGSGTTLDKYKGKLKVLKIDRVYAKDVNGNVIDVKVVNGTFVIVEDVTETLPGDVDGNGVVDSNDALLILKMSVGKERIRMKGDVNGDGRVLSDDAMEVLKMSSQKMIEKWKK